MEPFSSNRKRLAIILIAVAILSTSGRMSGRGAVVALPGYSITLLNDQIAGPVELRVDGHGNILVANEGAPFVLAWEDFVSKLDPDGVTLQREFIDGLEGASGLAVDDAGNIYVSQDAAQNIRKYGPTGALLFEFESHRPWFSDPDSLTLTNDGRLLAPVQAVDGPRWRVLAFDVHTGARLADFTPPFDFGFVNAAVFENGRVWIAGAAGNGATEPILVAEEGQAPTACPHTAPWGFGNVTGLALGADGSLLVADGARLLHVSTGGSVTPVATGFTGARGLAEQNGCVLVAEHRQGSDGAVYRVCAQEIPAAVTPGGLTQTYTGAPQTAAGTYPATATATATATDPIGDWQSTEVYYSDGKLQYATDSEGNRIPDFSYVGYRYGEDLPSVPVVRTISPVIGDNTSNIQNAVNYVGSLPKNSDGFRGALLLNPGTYSTDNPVYVPYDGVVIRGSGPSTLINSTRTGTDEAVFVLGNKSSDEEWTTQVAGSLVSITDPIVPIGERRFHVSNGTLFKVGDHVVIQHAPKSAWFSAIDDGGTHGDPGWSTLGADFTVRYTRFITAVSGNLITVDAPLYMRLDSTYASLSVFKYNTSTASSKVYFKLGIEHLRIEITTNGGTDESHTDSAVRFYGVIDGWARGLTMGYFKYSGIYIQRSTRITVEDCFSGPPVSQITGGRRYNYNCSTGAQQILFKNCVATDARHGFVSNGTVSASGIVVFNGELRNNITGSEGHRWWTTGMLFDSSRVTSLSGDSDSRGFCAYNRGDWGTSHGWGSANSVLWNIDAVDGTQNVVQKPPTAQNYAIGVAGATGNGPYSEPAGFIEGPGLGSTLNPRSLYLAQLADRTSPEITYALTVNSGTGGGSYAAGSAVTIAAAAAPAGQVFDTWVVNSGSPQITNVKAASTTLTMPAGAVTVTAQYTGGASSNSLLLGGRLTSYQYLESANGVYRFYLEGDGNLVLRNQQTGAVRWASGTTGKGGTHLEFQSKDGNLVLYTSANKAVWASKTAGKGCNLLRLNDDGTLVLYKGSKVIKRWP